MLIAFIGSHGTGKTTTCKALHRQLGKDWPIFADSYRKMAQQLGYSRPRDIILQEANQQLTVTAMTAASLGALNEWNQSKENHGLIDLGPPSVLAYHRYWMHICTTPASPFLLNLCKHISGQIDYYIYLPTDVINLVADSMRSDDPIFQKDIDQWVNRNLKELNIPEEKVIRLNEVSVEGRVNEIVERILPH